jgi:hypothetical protein
MREGSFRALTAKPQQTQAACAANAPTIAVHRSARLGMVLPVPSSAIGFRDVAADAHGFEIDERLIAVIALVADDFDTVSVGLYRLDLLGRFNQCLAARRRVSLIGILHGDADDRARLEIDRVLGFVQKCVRPSFILVISRRDRADGSSRRSARSSPDPSPDQRVGVSMRRMLVSSGNG